MTGCRTSKTPVPEGQYLRKPAEPITPEEVKQMEGFDYARIVCMLGWLMMISRPDLCVSVANARTRLADPRPRDKRYVRHILRYLAGTLDYGLRYTLDPDSDQPDANQIKLFVDSSFASEPKPELEPEDTTPENQVASRSGGVAVYGGAAVAWWSCKQTRTTRSSTDAEIVALDEGARRGLWLRQIGMAMGIDGAETIEIFEDNAQAVGFANNTRLCKRTKYIDIKYHAVRDDVAYGELAVTKVGTGDNLSDAMTKALGVTKFRKFRALMGVVPCTLHQTL